MSKLDFFDSNFIVNKNSNSKPLQFRKEIRIDLDKDDEHNRYNLLNLPEALKENLITNNISISSLKNMSASELADIINIEIYIANLMVKAARQL